VCHEHEESPGRVTLWTVVLLAVVLGVAAWALSGSEAPAVTASQPVPEAIGTAGGSYFPSQFVNQAKEILPHIQAF
jgi:hypothetical protein